MRRWLIARRWRVLLAVLAVLVVVATIGGWLLARSPSTTSAATTLTISSGTYQTTVSATGTVEPKKQAALDFGVSGQVTHVLVKAGDHVRKGQPLARVDATTLRASRTSASSALAAAQTAYTDDAADGASATQLAADSAQVASARAALSAARDDVRGATLRSTMVGTVASVDLTVGETVAGGSSQGQAQSTSDTSSSSSQVTVVSSRAYVVDATVSSSDVTSLKEGMQAQITPDGATTVVYGTVASVGRVADVSSSGAAEFAVTIDVTGSPKGLYAGTSATVSIIVKQAKNVLAVPSAALHTSGSTTYVEKMVNGKPVRTTVTVGTTFGIETQVVSGLKAGDEVQLPSSGGFTRTGTSGASRRTGFGGGGFGGGGFGGGGFGGGGFGGGGGFTGGGGQ